MLRIDRDAGIATTFDPEKILTGNGL